MNNGKGTTPSVIFFFKVFYYFWKILYTSWLATMRKHRISICLMQQIISWIDDERWDTACWCSTRAVKSLFDWRAIMNNFKPVTNWQRVFWNGNIWRCNFSWWSERFLLWKQQIIHLCWRWYRIRRLSAMSRRTAQHEDQSR